MAAGSSPFSSNQIRRLQSVLERAKRETGLDWSVYVGDVDDEPRRAAERLHSALGTRSADAVLVFVAPGLRRLEIVTGPAARRRLPDRSCGLASLSMTSSFSGGDLLGGITSGVRLLVDAAGKD